MDPELGRLVEQSAHLDRSMHRALRAYPEPETPRERIALSLARVAIQHGRSIVSLLSAGLDHGALALLRPQAEALARAYWVRLAADPGWLEKAMQPPRAGTKIEPAKFPLFAEAIDKIAAAGHQDEASRLRGDYESTKDQMHSYTHGGLRAVWLTLGGLDDQSRRFLLRLANSKSMAAWSYIALAIAKGNRVPRLSAAWDRYRDCQVWVPDSIELSGFQHLGAVTLVQPPE